MTITELRETYPDLFYSNQDWFRDERFMFRELPADAPTELPSDVEYLATPPDSLGIPIALELLVPAVVLVQLYVDNPDAKIWQRYLWTSDVDSLGQRIYVGCSGFGLEIHRHLAITERWGVPCWD